MSSNKNLSPESKFTLSLKEMVAMAIGFASLIGMYYTLQAQIQTAMELPKPEVKKEDLQVAGRVQKPRLSKKKKTKKGIANKKQILENAREALELTNPNKKRKIKRIQKDIKRKEKALKRKQSKIK